MNIEKIEIVNIKDNSGEGCVLVSLTIIFTKDNLKISGFRIMEKGEKKWLTPPSWRDNENNWHKIVLITNKDEWEGLEKKVLEQFIEEKEKNTHLSHISKNEIPQ